MDVFQCYIIVTGEQSPESRTVRGDQMHTIYHVCAEVIYEMIELFEALHKVI